MATESESGRRPCSEDGCTNGTWRGAEDLCLMHDDSPAAEALKNAGRQKGGSRSPNRSNLSRLEPPPPPETAREARAFLTWALGQMVDGSMPETTFDRLRKGVATLLKAIDVADLEIEAERTKRKIEEELGITV